MKLESNKFINVRKIVEYPGTGVATKFSKFMQLQGLIQLLFYMFLWKLKLLKSVSMEAKSSSY